MSIRKKLTRSSLRGLFFRLPGARWSKECSQVCPLVPDQISSSCFVQCHRSTGCFIVVNAQYCHMLVQSSSPTFLATLDIDLSILALKSGIKT